MTRAQYLQARNTQQLIATLVRELPLDEFLATIAEAETLGPAQSPRMWSEGHPALARDRALAEALTGLRKALP